MHDLHGDAQAGGGASRHRFTVSAGALLVAATVVVAAASVAGHQWDVPLPGPVRASTSTERVSSMAQAVGEALRPSAPIPAPLPATTTTMTSAPPPTAAAPTPTAAGVPPRPPTAVVPVRTPQPSTTVAPVTTTQPDPVTTTPKPLPPAPVAAPPTAPASSGLTSGSQADLLSRVNAVRATGTTCGGVAYASVPALTLQANLIRAAAGHADEMATYDYYSHTGLDGSNGGARMTAAGYHWHDWAENIAAGQPDAASVIAAWFTSPDHCQNFMSPALSQIGFALATSSSSTYPTYWVVDLGHP